MLQAVQVKHETDENQVDQLVNGKKFAATKPTKRFALGELQNRAGGAPRLGKDLIKKELDNALLAAKPRVDTHWKKGALPTKADGAANAIKAGTGSVITTTTTTTTATRKIVTRSSSVRTDAATKSSVLQRTTSTKPTVLAEPTHKSKTLTTKLVTSKIQQLKVDKDAANSAVAANKTSKTASTKIPEPNAIRREDSNLSRKSLTKYKSLKRDPIKPSGKLSSVPSNLADKKEKVKLERKSGDAINKKADVQKQNVKATLKIANVQSLSTNIQKNGVIIEKVKIVRKSDDAVIKKIEPKTKELEKQNKVKPQTFELPKDVENIDANDGNQMTLVSIYVNDIYDYLFNLEIEQPIYKDHLKGQKDISPSMRSVLLDWINEVHAQFHMASETYYIAVGMIDRYLQKVTDTNRSQLQLVGVTAVFIAAKVEDLYPPVLADFEYITDYTYTKANILKMEMQILQTLDFNLSRPVPIHFLRRFSKASKAEALHHTMAKYFLELSTMEYEMSHYRPSEVAAAALLLSFHLINLNYKEPSGFCDNLWTPTLVYYSRYSAQHLHPIVKRIATIVKQAPHNKLKAVYKKYEDPKLEMIALRPELSSVLLDSIVNGDEMKN